MFRLAASQRPRQRADGMHFPAELPALLTARLRLDSFTPGDAPEVQRLAGDIAVAATTGMLPHPYLDGMAEAWIGSHAEAWQTRREVVRAIRPREGGTIVGAISLTLAPEHERAELGYWIGQPHWNRGYATEAAQALVDYGFRVLGAERIQAMHFERNPASGRVLSKLGLHREGRSPGAFKRLGQFEDVVFYGVRRAEWLARAEPPP